MKRVDSIEREAHEVRLAAELIRLGARMQLLEAEISLSRERLLKLYKEIRQSSPPKGMLPFSTDWFMTWQPNVHASLFMNLYRRVRHTEAAEGVQALIAAYHLYLDQIEAIGTDPVLSVTRAWTLLRFFEADLVQLTPCSCCGAEFLTHAYEPAKTFVCGICHMPSRAGSSHKSAKAAISRGQKRLAKASI
ncbi:flagellar transcriptional regulator FlhC [Tepidiphilus olei]|uniref:flagellar transcriptional regulator FlhC n=1 Tax=Tepidiphilus olei TaxID=2502184 RepID=UPI00115D18DD|nr:flagellar transcriptional regulator FlhC [Tepidiphilus olei]